MTRCWSEQPARSNPGGFFCRSDKLADGNGILMGGVVLAWIERWAGVLGGAAAVLVLAGLWLFFQGGEDYVQRDLRGRTALIVAAEEGDLERVDYLLEQGVRIDAGDDCQWTAMMRAAAGGHSEILVRLLLSAGADTSLTNRQGQSVRDLALQASAGEPSARLEEIREVLGCQP